MRVSTRRYAATSRSMAKRYCSNRREIIFNEADFNAQVIGAVAKCLHEIDIKAKRDDRTYVAGILAGEYLREFNVIR